MLKEKSWLDCGVSAAAAITVLACSGRASQTVPCLVFCLATLVLLSLWLLLRLLKIPSFISQPAAILTCVPALIFAPASSLPIAAATSMHLSEPLKRTGLRISLCAAANILWAVFTKADISTILLAALFFVLSLTLSLMFRRRKQDFETIVSRSLEIDELRERALSQKRMAKSMEHTTKLMERNRLASRIHDEIGHGMSGSILLLEGAQAILKDDPEGASEIMNRVNENLRESVDKIRTMLKEERSETGTVSLSKIKNELLKFENDHPGIRAELDIEGSMDDISGLIWLCVFENMLEAMINMLKHSGGDLFHVHMTNRDKLLTVTFSDNGGSKGRDSGDSPPSPSSPGIGLQNIEERCALCYGRCFVSREPDGFYITMNFPLREEGG